MIRTKKNNLCKQQDLSVLNNYVLNKNLDTPQKIMTLFIDTM